MYLHVILILKSSFSALLLPVKYIEQLHLDKDEHIKLFFKTKNGNDSFATKLIALFYRFLVLKSRGANFSARTEA